MDIINVTCDLVYIKDDSKFRLVIDKHMVARDSG